MTRKKEIGTPSSATTKTTTRVTNKRKPKKEVTLDVFEKEMDNHSINEILPTKLNLKCRNIKQKEFVNLIGVKDVLIAYGPAGTGKSYTAIAKGIALLQTNPDKYHNLVIVKPAVEAEENLGFIPGNLKEKLEPHIASSMDIIDKLIGQPNRFKLEASKILKVEPIGFLRGKTIDNTILVLEEGQNLTKSQMKTLLTRIGENSKFIITGDIKQSDKFRNYSESGLFHAINILKGLDEIDFFEFSKNDIVRHPIIGKILDRYDIDEESLMKKISPKITPSKIIKTNPIMVSNSKVNKNKFSKFISKILSNFTW